MQITRAKFEELCADMFQSTLDPVEKALADAKMDKNEIDEIVLVGGSTRIPRIQKLLTDFFDGKELNLSINPDEAIAVGACAQAAILNGDESDMLQDLLLLDVTPLSLGLQTVGGKMTTLIPRNTTIPARETKIFSTSFDDQTSVLVQVFQGERALTKDNHSLGRFQLREYSQAPSRVPQIEVTFELDANGILNVTAVDKNTGNQNQITIKNVQDRNTKDQIDRMVKEAQAFKRQDEEHLERISSRNELKQYATHIKSLISQDSFKGRIDDSDWNKVSNKVEEIFDWMGDDEDAFKEDYERKRRELEAVSKPVMSKFKQNAKGNQRKPNASAEKPKAGPSKNKNARSGPVIEELD